MCKRWLAAIETQSEVKLEQPTLHAASTGTAVRTAQRKEEKKRKDSRKTGAKTDCVGGAHSVQKQTGGVRANGSADRLPKKYGQLWQFKVDASWTQV